MACWSPITLKNNSVTAFQTGKHMSVPCGKCLGCLQRKRSDWTLRIAYEEKNCISSCFVTLTYNEWSVPVTANGNLTLVKSDLQKYIKRINRPGVRFFGVGEYGSDNSRPHYHACIFNADIEKIYNKWGRYEDKFGFVDLGEVNPASIHYITKYMVNEDAINKNYLDAQKPFRLMSKGLGKGLADDYREYCNNHQSNIVRLAGGQQAVIPRYIDNLIFSKAQKWTIAEKAISESQKKEITEFYRLAEHREYLTELARITSKSNKC